MKPRLIKSQAELAQLFRDRRDELNIPHSVIDAIAGIPDGYAGKLLCNPPMRNFGEISLRAVLGALALGIIQIVVAEDPEQAAKIGHRWVQRKRSYSAPAKTRCVVKPDQPLFDFANTEVIECPTKTE